MTTTSPTIVAAGAGLRAGRHTSADLVEQCLATIGTRDGEVNAFTTVLAESARAAARAADDDLRRGDDRGPLHGIPVSVKDIIDIEGVSTSAASRVRAGHRAAADAVVTQRLRHAGAILIGKCNLHEFAFGTTGDASAFGPTHNPHAGGRIPGGSSSGSAASVAAGMALASIGTDTGGSIRIPASACGVVGLKPTFGEVSVDGIFPLAPSLDHVGPLAHTVADVTLVYEAIRDTPSDVPVDGVSLARLVGGVPRGGIFDRVAPEIGACLQEVVDRLARAGMTTADVNIPHVDDAAAIYLHTQLPEAAAIHRSLLETHAEEYDVSVRARLELGRYVLAEDYLLAQEGRRVLTASVDAALADVDVLLLPTLPVVPPECGADTVRIGGVSETVRAATLQLTQLFDVTGHPALSLPGGEVDGVPVGLQLVGRRHATASLLAAAASVETELGR